MNTTWWDARDGIVCRAPTQAQGRGIPIVTEAWLSACFEEGGVVDPDDYLAHADGEPPPGLAQRSRAARGAHASSTRPGAHAVPHCHRRTRRCMR